MATSKAALYALANYSLQPIDATGTIIIRDDTGAAALVDPRIPPLLQHLRVFRTISEHAAFITSRIPKLRGQQAAVEGSMGQLVARGLFVSADEVTEQIKASKKHVEPNTAQITLCIRTCDAPQRLRQLLQSLSKNASRFGTRWPIEILDDSKSPEHQASNRDLARTFAEQLSVQYIGLDEQEALIASLSQNAPEDAEALRWLLDARHPANQGEPTHGRLYNLAFMLHAGERILLIDDDALIEAWQWPQVHASPRFVVLPTRAADYANIDVARERLKQPDFDPIAAHADLLGRPLADGLRETSSQGLNPRLFAQETISALPHSSAPLGALRYTHNGFLGDTGSSSDIQMLLRLRHNLPECTIDDAKFQAFRQSPCCTMAASDRPELISGTHLHHTTCLGLDLSGLVPPVLPQGRSEDALLTALLRLMYPFDYGLRLPFALEHRTEDARTWRFEPERLGTPPDPSSALALWANLMRAPAEISPSQRLDLLRQTIKAAAADGLLRQKLTDLQQREQTGALAHYLMYTFVELQDKHAPTPDGLLEIPQDSAWRREVKQLQDWLAARLRDLKPGETLQSGLDTALPEICTYIDTLPAWTRAFASRS